MNSTQIHRILIPADFSETGEQALEHGAYLANVCRADMFLIHSMKSTTAYPPDWYNDEKQAKDKAALQNWVTEKLSRYAEDYTKRYGVYVKTILTSGNPAKKIAEAVAENDIDLIVMGTHGASGFEEFFIGSTAHKVVTMAPCPVITIPPHSKPPGFKSVILPIDDTRYSRQKVRNVVPIAAKSKSAVHILGLLDSSDVSDLAKFKVKLASVEEAVEKAGLICIKKIVKGDNLAVQALKYSEEVGAELLAIMTDHESSMTGIFMGAFAGQIVNHSKIPVLSIKPMVAGNYEAPG